MSVNCVTLVALNADENLNVLQDSESRSFPIS